ncbi:hypothetical protein GQ600_259 [Phytophthora cactorum]|nr:hypothetical protein GQ600_259 [Phytophthora cactorum]
MQLLRQFGRFEVFEHPKISTKKSISSLSRFLIRYSNSRNHSSLLPLHMDGNHWCGTVFNFKSSPPAILLFDPQQKGKCLDACEDILKELFPDQVPSNVRLS